jgi:hypothetical protein
VKSVNFPFPTIAVSQSQPEFPLRNLDNPVSGRRSHKRFIVIARLALAWRLYYKFATV